MGIAYSLKCPELRISQWVGLNGQLLKGVDKQGRDHHEMLTKFMYTCEGKEMFYVGDNRNNGPIDDVYCLDFDPERDYEERPVTDAEIEADRNDGWVVPTSEQLNQLAEHVVKGTLGHIHGVTIVSDVFREVKP